MVERICLSMFVIFWLRIGGVWWIWHSVAGRTLRNTSKTEVSSETEGFKGRHVLRCLGLKKQKWYRIWILSGKAPRIDILLRWHTFKLFLTQASPLGEKPQGFPFILPFRCAGCQECKAKHLSLCPSELDECDSKGVKISYSVLCSFCQNNP